ncbi:MAG TPA: class I adenylate-forming enzyme family protein, partial [Myxococcales bacterium]|nr:class I adenylate-forming enzyme family protein [Myxococcales bacterium]
LSFYRGKDLQGRLSYAALGERVLAVAGAMHAQYGVRQGDRVAILAPNRLEVPALVLALLRLGAMVVPLNPGSSPEEWTYILRHSGAKGICATADLAGRVPAEARPSFTLGIEDVFALAGGSPPAPEGSAADLPAAVLYTSGTTGNPKGVVLRQRNLLANGLSMARNFGLQHTTQLAVLPLYHAHAFGFGLMTTLTTSGHLVFMERLEPFTWAKVVRAESVEVSSVVPTMIPMLLAAGVTQAQVPSLRHLMVSSAPLAPDLARRFAERAKIPLIQGWGLSEYTNFACCVSPFDPPQDRERLMFGWQVPSVGPALEGTEVEVVDGAGVPQPEGTVGELRIRGHSTMAGYFLDDAATARALDPGGWLRTGDEGFFQVDRGRRVFFIAGRIKEIIIRDAEKYSPLQLERRLIESVPELSGRIAVVGFAHREHGEEVGAYLEVESFDEALRSRILAALESMPVAERPKILLHGARPIPRTHTGKVQRRKMQPWFEKWSAHRGPTLVEPVSS